MGLFNRFRKKMQKALPGYQGSKIWQAQKSLERSEPVKKARTVFEEGRKKKLADEKSVYSKWIKYRNERIKQIESGELPPDIYVKGVAIGALEFLKQAEVGGEAQKYINGAMLALQAYLAYSAAKDYVKAERARKKLQENLANVRREQERKLEEYRKAIEIAEEEARRGLPNRPAYAIERLPGGGYIIKDEKNAVMKYLATLDAYGATLVPELEKKEEADTVEKKKFKKIRRKKLKRKMTEEERIMNLVVKKAPHYAKEVVGVMKYITNNREKYPKETVAAAEKVLKVANLFGIKSEEIAPSEIFSRSLQYSGSLKPAASIPQVVESPVSRLILRTLGERGRKKRAR